MIIWAENIYISDNLKGKQKKTMARINTGKATVNVFCIAFSTNNENLFDIYDANELLFPYYKKRHIVILGLTRGKEDAILIVKEMIDEIYRETGGFKVRDYFV